MEYVSVTSWSGLLHSQPCQSNQLLSASANLANFVTFGVKATLMMMSAGFRLVE